MASIVFGELLQLMLTELSQTIEKSNEQAQAARVRIDDIELEIPAHLQLLAPEVPAEEAAANPFAAGSPAQPARLLVGMPSPREALPVGRVGRIRVTFEAIKGELPNVEEWP